MTDQFASQAPVHEQLPTHVDNAVEVGGHKFTTLTADGRQWMPVVQIRDRVRAILGYEGRVPSAETVRDNAGHNPDIARKMVFPGNGAPQWALSRNGLSWYIGKLGNKAPAVFAEWKSAHDLRSGEESAKRNAEKAKRSAVARDALFGAVDEYGLAMHPDDEMKRCELANTLKRALMKELGIEQLELPNSAA